MPVDSPPKVFFVSPIGKPETGIRKKADHTLKYFVRKALEHDFKPLNCKVDRADEEPDPGLITQRMLNGIMNADLVVIDLTDHNANVFYEMAVAHGYHKPCVNIITEGQKPPFDVQDMNTVEYNMADPEKMEAAVIKLQAYAQTALQKGTHTPLSAAQSFNVLQSSGNSTDIVLAEIVTRLDSLQAAVRDTGQLAMRLDDLETAVREASQFGLIRPDLGYREEVRERAVMFKRDYVQLGSGAPKTYAQGTKGVILRVYRSHYFDRATHVDVRLPDGDVISGLPIDYFTEDLA